MFGEGSLQTAAFFDFIIMPVFILFLFVLHTMVHTAFHDRSPF